MPKVLRYISTTIAIININLFLVVSLLLSACGSASIRAYPEPDKPLHEISIIKAQKENNFDLFFQKISKLSADSKSNWKSTGNSWTGFADSIQTLPGRYAVLVHCTDNKEFGTVILTLEVQAGNTYNIQCKSSLNNKNEVKAYVDHVTKSKLY